jgi:hypothetical protein
MMNTHTEPEPTTDELLGYDADHSDSDQFCDHGTFIGSWWGPDYLCGWCEDGVSPEDYQRAMAHRARRAASRNAYLHWCDGLRGLAHAPAGGGYHSVVVGTIVAMAAWA